jgi:Na+-translocating ferredoxin:NAD+ oxidoreductase RnfG subunit
MNKGLVSGLVLLALGLVCGLLLAGVNHFTAPVIKRNEDAVKFAALNEFYDVTLYDVEEVALTGAIDTAFLIKEKGTSTLVAVVYSVQSYGYQSSIKLLIAVSSDKTIQGYKVVSQGETSGFGDKSLTHDFKVSGSMISDLSGFDSIAGATITSDAIKASFLAVAARVNTDFGGGN